MNEDNIQSTANESDGDDGTEPSERALVAPVAPENNQPPRRNNGDDTPNGAVQTQRHPPHAPSLTLNSRSTLAETHAFIIRPLFTATSLLLFRLKRRPAERIVEMHLEGPYRFNTTLTLTAKKIGKKGVADGSLYNMYIGTGGWNRTVTLDQAEEKGLVVCVGRVVSNFLGTRFSVIHDGLPAPGGNQDTKEREKGKEVACITYQPNLFGHKGPRRMTILAPFLDDLGQSVVSSSQSSLYDIFKSGQTDQLLTLQNKDPVWNEETESFVLNFNGRVTLASVKNFQIVSDKDLDFISLQFGRVSGDTFTMDMRAPFCPIQAFGIALSSLDTKLACE